MDECDGAVPVERRRARRRLSTRGRAPGGLIAAALVVCLVVVGAAFLLLRGGAEAPEAAPRGSLPDPRAPAPVAELEPAPESGARPKEPAAERSPGPASPGAFEGRGNLRGEVVAGPGTVLPEEWTLVLEPSPVLRGRERAASRRVEFQHGETAFELLDLPLAGYRLRAEALGRNGSVADVLLVATSPSAFVTLAFSPAGLLDGQVRCADGAPAEGLAVTLEDVHTRARRTTECDVNGAWVLRDVVDGEYVLYLGPPEAPLVRTRELVFRAPSLRAPEERLPEVGGLRIAVLDEEQTPVPGTTVTGSSNSGGAFEVRTDASGLAHARFLLPGTWRLEARAREEVSGRVSVDVDLGPDAEVTIHVRP